MAEIGFYHLDRTPLDDALPKLLEKAVASGARMVLRAPDAIAVERLNRLLWTYNPSSFLPHGSLDDGHPEEQPVYLTATDEAPNGADVLVQVAGATMADLSGFRRVLDLFDGSDETAVAAARDRWRAYKEAGHDLTYWQQKPEGGWSKRA